MKLGVNHLEEIDQAGFLDLSALGGLTQFGVMVDTHRPGGVSSERHWHDSEDEFLFMLSGTATLEDNDGLHELGPGDAVSWPYGVANGHHLLNRTEEPCSFLIVGSRVAGDRCHYPDSGTTQINGDKTWSVVDAAGQVLRGGDLPSHLLNLPPVWGERGPGPFAGISRAAGRQATKAEGTVHPVLGGGLGPYAYQLLSDPGGLSQFGAFIETMPHGSATGFRHWHEAEDELVIMLAGEVVLVEDREDVLRPGDVACWPKGAAVGHRLDNRSGAEASYLVIGTRLDRDVIHFPDHGLYVHKDGAARAWFHADGRPREG